MMKQASEARLKRAVRCVKQFNLWCVCVIDDDFTPRHRRLYSDWGTTRVENVSPTSGNTRRSSSSTEKFAFGSACKGRRRRRRRPRRRLYPLNQSQSRSRSRSRCRSRSRSRSRSRCRSRCRSRSRSRSIARSERLYKLGRAILSYTWWTVCYSHKYTFSLNSRLNLR